MYKRIRKLILLIILSFFITGCKNYRSFIYKVESGDRIRIELETSNGYDIDGDLPFTIKKDNEKLCQGTFIDLEDYDKYVKMVNDENINKIITNGNKNGMTYLFYNHNNEEWNYIIKINDSKTAVLIGNVISQDSAEQCFNRLSMNVE